MSVRKMNEVDRAVGGATKSVESELFQASSVLNFLFRFGSLQRQMLLLIKAYEDVLYVLGCIDG